MRFSRVTLVACLVILLAIVLASPSSGEKPESEIESRKLTVPEDKQTNLGNKLTDDDNEMNEEEKPKVKKEEKEEKEMKEEKKMKKTKKVKAKKAKKAKKVKKVKKASKKTASKESPEPEKSSNNLTGDNDINAIENNDKRVSLANVDDPQNAQEFISSIPCGELKLNSFKNLDVTRCLCDDKNCPCVLSSKFPCMCTNCSPTGNDFFNCIGCNCLEFP